METIIFISAIDKYNLKINYLSYFEIPKSNLILESYLQLCKTFDSSVIPSSTTVPPF